MAKPKGDRRQPGEETVMVHRAESWTEATVIRGLLESAGIPSPPLTRTDPYPLSNPPADFPGAEILVREPDAEEARRIIDEYLSEAEKQPPESDDEAGDEPEH